MSRPDLTTVAAGVARLGDLDAPQLRALWPKVFGMPPPAHMHRPNLVRLLAYRIQEEVHGGLSKVALKTLEAVAAQECDGAKLSPPPPRKLRPGTKLVREWQGGVHEVFVTADGFVWNGRRFGSLSAIATAITGTRWNGKVFFGLKSAARTKPAEQVVDNAG